MNRYFELIDQAANHRKFWEIIVDGTTVNVHYGRIGTSGQIQVKTFPTTAAANAHVQKLIHEKKNKGYVEKVAGVPKPVHAPLPKPVFGYVEPNPKPKPAAPPMPLRPTRMKISRIRRKDSEGESD